MREDLRHKFIHACVDTADSMDLGLEETVHYMVHGAYSILMAAMASAGEAGNMHFETVRESIEKALNDIEGLAKDANAEARDG